MILAAARVWTSAVGCLRQFAQHLAKDASEHHRRRSPTSCCASRRLGRTKTPAKLWADGSAELSLRTQGGVRSSADDDHTVLRKLTKACDSEHAVCPSVSLNSPHGWTGNLGAVSACCLRGRYRAYLSHQPSTSRLRSLTIRSAPL